MCVRGGGSQEVCVCVGRGGEVHRRCVKGGGSQEVCEGRKFTGGV